MKTSGLQVVRLGCIVLSAILTASCEEREELEGSDYQSIDPAHITLTISGQDTTEVGGQPILLILETGSTVPDRTPADIKIEGAGSFSNGKKTLSHVINSNESISMQIWSDSTGGAMVLATLSGLIRTKNIFFTPSIPEFEIVVQQDSVPADNLSEAVLEMRIVKTNLMNWSNSVEFTTNRGSFSNGTGSIEIPVNIDSTARVYLKHDRNEIAVVTGTILDFSKQASVIFTIAWPDALLVEPAASVIENLPGSHVKISTTLVRRSGSVSGGLDLIWGDSTDSDSSPGIFLNTTPSDMTGRATTEYHLQDTSFTGEILLIAEMFKDDSHITGVNRIVVTKNSLN